MTTQVKLDSFYGAPQRPFLLLDKDGNKIQRVHEPKPANYAMVKLSKSLKKPTYSGSIPPKPRNEFAIFCEEERANIIAGNPSLFLDKDPRVFKAAAARYWGSTLSEAQRQAFRDKAHEEREARNNEIDALIEKDPAFKEYLQKEAIHRRAVKGMPSPGGGPSAAAAMVEADKESPAAQKSKKKEKKENGVKKRRVPKVPEALKLKVTKHATKRYHIRSKTYAEKLKRTREGGAVDDKRDGEEETKRTKEKVVEGGSDRLHRKRKVGNAKRMVALAGASEKENLSSAKRVKKNTSSPATAAVMSKNSNNNNNATSPVRIVHKKGYTGEFALQSTPPASTGTMRITRSAQKTIKKR